MGTSVGRRGGGLNFFFSGPKCPPREKKQHDKHKLSGPNFLQTFLTLTPGCPGVKKFLPSPGPQENALFGADVHDFWRGRP